MKVYVLRHGETPWNKALKVQGSTDIPLNEKGIALAIRTKEGFEKEGLTFDHVFSSPLIRAKKTAEIAVEGQGVPVVEDEKIREIHFGDIEGMKIKDTKDKEHYPNAYACFFDTVNYVPQGQGETFQEVHNRVRNFINEQLAPLEGVAENVLVVCHGGILRTFLSVADEKELKDFWEVHQPNCCINIFEMEQGKLKTLEVGKVYYQE